MRLLSFIQGAGEKLFGLGEAQAAPVDAPPTAAGSAPLNDAAGQAIAKYIQTMGLSVKDLNVRFDPNSATVTVAGIAADLATREKVVLCCGNVAHVASVNDQLTVEAPTIAESQSAESQWHTVVKGDNLSKIAKTAYGDANKYPVIFEANKPMLTHPDKIYPGQVLRIPAQA